MKKKIYLAGLFAAIFAFCHSQVNTPTQGIFMGGGYRVNGGKGAASVGYESPSIGKNLSLYSSINLGVRNKTILGTMVVEKDYFLEAGIKKTFPLSEKVHTFFGAGAVAGKNYIRKTDDIPAQDSATYGGSVFIGGTYSLSRHAGLFVSPRYTYTGSHDICVMAGLKFYF